MQDLILFLDFDGVLHHSFKVKNSTDNENSVFYYVPFFNEFVKSLSDFYNVKIVFSTSWKEKFSFQDLYDFFEEYLDIQEKIIDITPNLKIKSKEGYKFKEMCQWIEKQNYEGQYLIIDDEDHLWIDPEENNLWILNHIVLCHNGFHYKEKEMAYELLSNLKNKQMF